MSQPHSESPEDAQKQARQRTVDEELGQRLELARLIQRRNVDHGRHSLVASDLAHDDRAALSTARSIVKCEHRLESARSRNKLAYQKQRTTVRPLQWPVSAAAGTQNRLTNMPTRRSQRQCISERDGEYADRREHSIVHVPEVGPW